MILGARFDATWMSSPQHRLSQLHLLVAAYPPSREDGHSFLQLVKVALSTGLNPLLEEGSRGRNAFFLLCEAMAAVSSDHAPEHKRLVKLFLEMQPQVVTDRAGRTVLEITDTVPDSAWSVVKGMVMEVTGGSVRSRITGNGGAAAARYAWDAVSPPLSSALPPAPAPSRVNSSIIAHARAPGWREGQGKATSTNASVRSYFDDDEEDEDLADDRSHRLRPGAPSAAYQYRR